MSFTPTLLPRCCCFDASAKFDAGMAARLKAASYSGQPLKALWRYVSLGHPGAGDITVAERDAILGAGWLLGLVQHVQYPHWSADPASGIAHGKASADHAAMVGYPQGCHIGLDMEGLGNSGAPVMGYVVSWADAVHAAGYRVLMYVGYDDGLPDPMVSSLASQGYVDAFWSDFGPRTLPAALSFAMKQHVQTTVAGIGVDPDEVLVGGVIAVMGPDAPVTLPDLPPDPASAPEDDPHTA